MIVNPAGIVAVLHGFMQVEVWRKKKRDQKRETNLTGNYTPHKLHNMPTWMGCVNGRCLSTAESPLPAA